MALSEMDTFSFTWHIENFTMCPQLCKDPIESPTCVMYGTKWKLVIHPRGYVDENFISFYLHRMKSSDKEEAITIGLDINALSLDAKKNVGLKIQKRTFEKDSNWGYHKFCSREDILNKMNGFLPNDTFTLECRIWRIIDEGNTVLTLPAPVFGDSYLAFSDSSLRKEMLTTAVRNELLDFQNRYTTSHYLARTRVRVNRKCIIWPIGKVGALRPNQRLTIPVVTTDVSAPSFAMTLYLSGNSVDDQSLQIEIRIEESNSTKLCFVKCRITAVSGLMKAHHVTEDDHFFQPTRNNDVWKFPTFLQMSTLKEEKYLDATEGTLNLQCEFASSNLGDEFHIEGTESVPLLNRFPKSLKGELNHVLGICKQMYEEHMFSDIAIHAGDRSFKAHKSVLSARSPVFRAMFETDMKENESGVVDITDYDSDTVEQLLAFIYTNSLSLEDLQQGKAMKLYSVADKYEVLSLKWHCSNHLKSTMSISNVRDVLNFADLHQDGDLLHHVKCFIQLNSNVILRSQMWKDLIKSNGSLTSQVMLDLLTGEIGNL